MKQTRQDFFTANGEGIKIMTFAEFARYILHMECGERLELYAGVNRQTKECSRALSVKKEQWNDTTENLNVENIIPPPFEELINFFKELNAPLIEAQKFFNHYESNGWLVAGKSKMKNWKASVENWLEKSNRFNSISPNHIPSPKNLQATTNKSYKEQL